MKDTIKDLWYGNIEPVGYCGGDDRELNSLLERMERQRNLLADELVSQQFELVKKYIEYSDKYAFRSATVAFTEGFCLACKLMAEAFVA